ncbi:hypothetical protein EB796_015673 [Bugula neritina]|uniref:Uncharacterized protein n=1 Tax=Bugula neritina TaxID=10212 RepID=A0A7J7JK95_BUGNE|nr:hypothetical protein EB796_015673 [Bugula neritina]
MNFSDFNDTFDNKFLNVMDICDRSEVPIALLTINCISILINILHLIVLRTVQSLRSSKYYQVLVHGGVSDVVAGIGFVVIAVCALEDTINRQSLHIISIANSVMEGILLATGLLRANLIGISSYERYVSLCDSFNYETHKVFKILNDSLSVVGSVAR